MYGDCCYVERGYYKVSRYFFELLDEFINELADTAVDWFYSPEYKELVKVFMGIGKSRSFANSEGRQVPISLSQERWYK